MLGILVICVSLKKKQLCDVVTMVIIHPQGDLVVFGFTPTVKVEIY
jgi:hypothetical protein